MVHFGWEQIFAGDWAERQSRALVAAHGRHRPQARRESGLMNSVSDQGRYERMHSRQYPKWIHRSEHGSRSIKHLKLQDHARNEPWRNH
jgi:hypothetical protein